jgi:general secretion pathway protein C
MNWAKASGFAVWGLVGLSVTAWALRFASTGSGPVVPGGAMLVASQGQQRADLGRVWGADVAVPAPATPTPVAQDSRLKLVGVAAAMPGQAGGLALISVDGKPARAYQFNQPVLDDWVLQWVGPRDVQLGPRGGPAALRLELPPLPAAQTGSLPAALPAN